ncbi:MAG: FmdB family zinc ribbon protein [Steroidobacteraceae bacterium]
MAMLLLEQFHFAPMMRGGLLSGFATWKSNRHMPFYEYECSACKYYVETLQKISDPPLKKCPSCGKATMQRLISAPVFRLKGAGWYETDFKSDKENKRNLADDKEPVAAAADSDDKPAKVQVRKVVKRVAAKTVVKKVAKKIAKKTKVAKQPAKDKVKAKLNTQAKTNAKVTRTVAKKKPVAMPLRIAKKKAASAKKPAYKK